MLIFINGSISDIFFLRILKLTNITPAYNKDSKYDKPSYRPVSVLPILSKLFENLIYHQVPQNFGNIFSQYQVGFRKGFNAKNYLLVRIKKFRKCLVQGAENAALLTDLSKAFGCLPHLIIAKFHAYGFDRHSLKLIHSYLSERLKINTTDMYSDWRLI